MYAFTDWDGFTTDPNFTGLQNFSRVFLSGPALAALINTLSLALYVTVVQNLIGLCLALGVNSQRVRSRNALRVVFFAPVVLTPLVAGYVWAYILAPDGTVNVALRAVGLDALTRTWLGDPETALWGIAVAIIWQFSGYSMVIYLAGLQAIPKELYEAADLDGAGPFRRFRYIVAPLLNGAFLISLVLTLIGTLAQFDQVIAMTGGGPGRATETITTVIYKQGVVQGQYGYAVSLAVVMTVVVAVLAVIQYKVVDRRVNE
jgi:raffinose/stachyose/melibiose transport system permease protein